jgi:hypothetical protein
MDAGLCRRFFSLNTALFFGTFLTVESTRPYYP